MAGAEGEATGGAGRGVIRVFGNGVTLGAGADVCAATAGDEPLNRRR